MKLNSTWTSIKAYCFRIKIRVNFLIGLLTYCQDNNQKNSKAPHHFYLKLQYLMMIIILIKHIKINTDQVIKTQNTNSIKYYNKQTLLLQMQSQIQEENDNYKRIFESVSLVSQSSKVFLIIGWISRVILFCLIILYCILSPSLFSTVHLLLMLIGFSLFINPYYKLSKDQADQPYLYSYNVEKWWCYVYCVISLLIIVIKSILYGLEIYRSVSVTEAQFLQIQSAVNAFLPILLFPFGLGSCLVQNNGKKLKDSLKYSEVIKLIRIPLIFLLGGSILIIQIFSISIIGLVFFMVMMFLFFQPETSFKAVSTKLIVAFTQIFSGWIIVFNFLVNCNFISQSNAQSALQLIGLNGLFQFSKNLQAPGYFVTLVIVYVLTVIINRCIAQSHWIEKGRQILPISMIDILRERGIDVNEEIVKEQNSITQRFDQKSIKVERQLFEIQDKGHKIKRRSQFSNKVINNQFKQLQLQQIRKSQIAQIKRSVQQIKEQGSIKAPKQRQSFKQQGSKKEGKQYQESRQRFSRDELMNNSLRDQILNRNTEGIKIEKDNNPNNKKEIQQNCSFYYDKLVQLLNSSELLLRLTELLSIIVIQRYNNIYSFGAVIWLATVASIENFKVVWWLTCLMLLPLEIGNFVIMYLYNMTNSPVGFLQGKNMYGFQQMQLYWLDVTIFNIYLFLMILFLQSGWKRMRFATSSFNMNHVNKRSIFNIVVGFLFKYSYLLTMVGIFLLGFSSVNLINLVYVGLLLVFLAVGQNIVFEKSNKRGKQQIIFTTFSRKYWFIIAYFTLLCIVAKYIYFLFFNGTVNLYLDPTGINQQYNWVFNFSLSSQCVSNTTPFFLIFVLAELQIIIYRSKIYTSNSFSLVSDFIQLEGLKKHKITFKKIVNLILEFYYQSLYYVFGFFILVCSYRWSFFGLVIIILTGWGMMRGFTRGLLVVIVFIDLAYLFLNYLVLFLEYDIIIKLIGQSLTSFIENLSLFLGFKLEYQQTLYLLFILNITIFWLCTQCYGLASILATQNFVEQSYDDNESLYTPTILDSDIYDIKFAQTYAKNVIQATKNHYNTPLPQKYEWFRNICELIVTIFTDCILITVLVCCLYFRLSLSMLGFLIIYLMYFHGLFNEVCQKYKSYRFYNKIERQIQKFSNKNTVIVDRLRGESIAQDKLEQQSKQNIDGQVQDQILKITEQIKTESPIQRTIQFAKVMKIVVMYAKYASKKRIWIASSIFSIVCLTLTYLSQFTNSQFYIKYIKNDYFTNILIQILYVAGFYVNPTVSLFSQIYFYYLMIGLNLIDKSLMYYMDWKKQYMKRESQFFKKQQQFQFVDIHTLPVPETQFVDSIEIMEDLQVIIYQQLEQIPRKKYNQLYQQANILIYFDFKYAESRIRLIYAIFSILIRFFTLLMLINLYVKSNIFSFAYLLTGIIFWFRKLQFNMIRDLNRAAICILLLQYIILLLDINIYTSPLPLPTNTSLSLLDYLIQSKDWINYLTLGSDQTSLNNAFGGVFINSLIIFLTQVYLFIYQIIVDRILNIINEIYRRYDHILQRLSQLQSFQSIYLNYDNYKHFPYRFLKNATQILITNSYIIISIMTLILLSNVNNYLSLGLIVFACFYIYVGIFTDLGKNKIFYRYTQIYFHIMRVILFLIFLASSIAQIPYFNISKNSIYNKIAGFVQISQIFLLFFIQIWLDLSYSIYFANITKQYHEKFKNRQRVLLKCLAYQFNNYYIQNLIKSYRQMLGSQVNIIQAMRIIKDWHKMMAKNMNKVNDAQQSFSKLQTIQLKQTTIQLLRKEIKQEQQKRPEDDEDLLQKFQKLIINHSHVSLAFTYYQTLKYIILNNQRVLTNNLCQISIWDYILEDYDQLYSLIQYADKQMQGVVTELKAQEKRIDQVWKARKPQSIDSRAQGYIKTPSKILLPTPQTKQSLIRSVYNFLLSNFSYVITFFICVYYLINPCLLSAPFIIYIFSYEIISDRKWTSVMLIYVFLIVILGLVNSIDSYSQYEWTKYLFYTNGYFFDFQIPYLMFLFVLIFINEEINKYRGNKFYHYDHSQNILQAALRNLLNEDQNSPAYLWKMRDDETQHQSTNPFQYFTHKLNQEFVKLEGRQLPTFVENLAQNKVGIDLYPYIATVQIIIAIYLIFFYPLMIERNKLGLEQSYKYFQFSTDLVLSVLAHVISMVIQRWITLLQSSRYKQMVKYIYTMCILALFCFFIYVHAPYNPYPIQKGYQPTGWLKAFSFFYFIYFFLSALQVRFGYRKYKSLNSFMTRRRQFNNIVLIIFNAIPFLLELKTIMDWSFCSTSLQIFDWFRLFGIYYAAFKAKMQYYAATGVELGSPIWWLGKIIGWIGFIIILLIILGPMILFSGLNPIAQPNLVIGGSMELGIQIIGGNYFTLYQTSHFSQPPAPFTQQEFNAYGFNQIPLLQTMNSQDLADQFQNVNFQPFSDSFWGMSTPNYDFLTNSINQTLIAMQLNQTTISQYQFVVKYQLQRSIAQTIGTGTNFTYPSNGSLNYTQLLQFNRTFTQCNQPMLLQNFYIALIRLNTIGNSYKPRPIIYYNQGSTEPLYQYDISLQLSCDPGSKDIKTSNVYWSVNTTNTASTNGNGVFLYVLCDKYQNLIAGYGFTALYTSVILVVAGFLRTLFDGNIPMITYMHNPKPDNIIQIAEAIGTLRIRKQFRQEYLMYYELIDIIRSPQIMKFMSGSYPVLIQQVDNKRIKKLQQKQQRLKNVEIQKKQKKNQ